MNIIVLMKQTPDTAQLSGTVDGFKLSENGGPRIVNPWDEYAIETAIQMKETHDGKVTVLCMGKEEAKDALKTALAMGVDEAVLISDPAMEGSDSLATAHILVAAIRKTGDFDILIGGRAAIDGNMSATAVQVAALLDIPQISYVADLIEVNPDAKTIKAVRLLEKAREAVTSTLPAMITVVKEINEPRYPSLIGIRKAARAEVPVWNLTDLGLDASEVGLAGSRVTWQVELPIVREAQVEIIEGPPAEAAKKLIDRLLEEKVI